MTRLTSSVFAVALVAGCVGSRSLKTGQPCPCAPGWSCDTAANTCVAPSVDASTEGGEDADASIQGDGATAAGSCACDTAALVMSPLGQQSIMVSRDCFCASEFGFLCHDFDQVAALCARANVHMVSASGFDGCTRRYVDVTIGSAAKGRPTYATLKFDGNSFFGAMYEADLVCNNLPADEKNDMYLRVATEGYFDLDPSCGSSVPLSSCSVDAGTNPDACSALPVTPCGDIGQGCCVAIQLEGLRYCSHGACVPRVPAGCNTTKGDVCVDCGGKGQPCCDTNQQRCGAGLACDYPVPTCTDACGAEGGPCCGGHGCQDGLYCSSFTGNGSCIRCGGPGQACCTSAINPFCSRGECNDAGVCESPDAF